ncbi:hypothetical protein [Enterococcus rivorum]|uniref:Uncharacterized protein n=1 Tax=Enterococcus rivorum TaxID=762845 RepID=A0A1E5KW69_9ENTE|nr:hypothetical protein [Enterococcus rivorum]MBP2100077.1 hypothetical protein [Enterococcus rivorum]OEH82123.1 hypothetical protein BCR26_14390 [Enterococcus rivorum]
MFDTLDKLWKELQKNVQKANVRAIGRAINQNTVANKNKVEKAVGEALKIANGSLKNTRVSLQQSVKGQFGKKVTEVFEQQQQTLDDF